MSNGTDPRSEIGFGPQRATFSVDDGLWIAEYPVSELLNIIADPVKWVKGDPELEGNSESFTLLPNYMIHIFPTLPAPEGQPSKILVQGIDKTNVITIQPVGKALRDFSRNVDAALGGMQVAGWPDPDLTSSVQAFMSAPRLDDDFFATVCMDESEETGAAFLHFQVFRPKPDLNQKQNSFLRAATAAQFHLDVVETKDFFSKGLEEVLEKEPPQFLRRTPGGLQPMPADDTIRVTSNPVDTPLPIIILGTEGDTGVACEILVANYLAGDRTYTYQQVYYKPYAS